MNKKIMVVDTETVSIDKKFCYNIGYTILEIVDSENYTVLEKRDFLVKQVWRNTMLFSTAYYANKKPIYTNMLRHKEDYNNISVLKYNEIMEAIQKDIDFYNIEFVYAYNSPFDEAVFEFNCDWFKCENPFAELPFYDIRAYFIDMVENTSNCYKSWCDKKEYYTDNGNYSTTAEIAYRFVTGEDDFIESHTALHDSEIESIILTFCYRYGMNIFSELKAPKMLKREIEKAFTIKYKNKKYTFKGNSATWYKKKNTFVIR